MQFINDLIHMTEGEKLVEYWWLWLIMLILFCLYILYKNK